MIRLNKVIGFVNCDGEVMTADRAMKKIGDGYRPSLLETITDEYMESVLRQASADPEGSEPVSALNNGEQIIWKDLYMEREYIEEKDYTEGKEDGWELYPLIANSITKSKNLYKRNGCRIIEGIKIKSRLGVVSPYRYIEKNIN